MADFAHTRLAEENRERKASALYLTACRAGLAGIPDDPAARLQLRKDAELPRDPSPETWAVAAGMLKAWPPAIEGEVPPCTCTTDPDADTGVLYEAPPRDLQAVDHRFLGWLCPHNSPAYLGCHRDRAATHIPTIRDNDRAAIAFGVYQIAEAGRRRVAKLIDETVPTGLLADIGWVSDPEMPTDEVHFVNADGSVAAVITVPPAEPEPSATHPEGEPPDPQSYITSITGTPESVGEPAPDADWWAI